MTTGTDIARFVAAKAPLSLTQVFQVHMPVRLDALGQDEIAFIYADGSRYITGLTSDDEYLEFECLRERLADTQRNAQ
jgi:hypothetical protein